jgi:hypothetical protein
VVSLALVLSACGVPAYHPAAGRDLEARWLHYLENGKTSREEVLRRLGVPSAQFENQRILTYRLGLDKDSGFRVMSRELDRDDARFLRWDDAEYSLVLVFDAEHVLRRHRLVPVIAPWSAVGRSFCCCRSSSRSAAALSCRSCTGPGTPGRP